MTPEFGEVVADCLVPGDCSRSGDSFASTNSARSSELWCLDVLDGELQERFGGTVAVVPYPVGIVDDADLAGARQHLLLDAMTSR